MSGRLSELRDRGCDVLGISTDDIATHARWLTTPPGDGGLGALQFPLASDVEGTACTAYSVYLEQQNAAQRGVFIIDPNGVLQYQVVHSLSVGRSTDELLRVLDALQSGGLCPGERDVGQATLDVRSELGPGRVLGPYEIESELGRGAFGTVYRAKDGLLDRYVALKVLHSHDDDIMKSLLSEARAAAALNHPNVCIVHSVDVSHGAPVIVMEHVDGQPLRTDVEPEGPDSASIAAVIRQLCGAMSAAHAAGVVHGDLKPDNLMVTADGTIKIMDFGLARRSPVTQDSDSATLLVSDASAGLSGTPRYMAPELARGGKPTPATDVFAVGLMICELLTGSPVVTGDSLLDVLQHIDGFDAAEVLPTVPESFRGVVAGALASDPQRRMTMSEMQQAIAAL